MLGLDRADTASVLVPIAVFLYSQLIANYFQNEIYLRYSWASQYNDEANDGNGKFIDPLDPEAEVDVLPEATGETVTQFGFVVALAKDAYRGKINVKETFRAFVIDVYATSCLGARHVWEDRNRSLQEDDKSAAEKAAVEMVPAEIVAESTAVNVSISQT